MDTFWEVLFALVVVVFGAWSFAAAGKRIKRITGQDNPDPDPDDEYSELRRR